MTTSLIYTGSIAAARGGQITHREVCHCPECAECHFRCPHCGHGVEYGWAQCPHDPAEGRLLNVTVADLDGHTHRLLHVRESSVRPA